MQSGGIGRLYVRPSFSRGCESAGSAKDVGELLKFGSPMLVTYLRLACTA